MTGRFTRLEFDEEGQRGAKQDQRRALEGTPRRDAQHYAMLAIEAHQLGQFEQALQMFTRAVREERSLVRAWVGQVQMLVQLSEYAEARLWSDKALELFRDNGELLAAKAQACCRQGDVMAGMAFSDASLRSQGSSSWRWEVRGEVLLVRGESLFRTCFEKALAEPAADWFDRVIVAGILLFNDRAAGALEFAQKALALNSVHPYNWLLQGKCQAAMGWHEAAQTSFERSLELTPRLAEAQQAIEALQSQSSLRRIRRRIGSWFRR